MKKVISLCLAAILLFGCSSKYISKKDTKPHKTDITKGKYYTAQQLSGSILTVTLQRQITTTEFYYQESRYKRKTAAGSYLSSAGLLGFLVALAIEKPKEPEIPSGSEEYQETWKIENNYDEQIQIYNEELSSYKKTRNIVYITSGAFFIGGILIHKLYNNSEYCERVPSNKVSNNIESITKVPLEISIGDSVVELAKTNEYGSYSFDLLKYRKLVANRKKVYFNFTYPENNAYSESIEITTEKIESIVKEQEQIARKEEEKRAHEQLRLKYEQEQQDRLAKRKEDFKKKFTKGVENILTLVMCNPYDTKGHCYSYTGTLMQLLGRSVALYKTDNFVCMIDFGEESAPKIMIDVLVEGVGVYTYITTNGTYNTIPKLKIVAGYNDIRSQLGAY
jgi:hypothetical protein